MFGELITRNKRQFFDFDRRIDGRREFGQIELVELDLAAIFDRIDRLIAALLVERACRLRSVADQLVGLGIGLLGREQSCESALRRQQGECTRPVRFWPDLLWPASDLAGSDFVGSAFAGSAFVGSVFAGSFAASLAGSFLASAWKLTGINPSRVSRLCFLAGSCSGASGLPWQARLSLAQSWLARSWLARSWLVLFWQARSSLVPISGLPWSRLAWFPATCHRLACSRVSAVRRDRPAWYRRSSPDQSSGVCFCGTGCLCFFRSSR